jgi:hypothetical protein
MSLQKSFEDGVGAALGIAVVVGSCHLVASNWETVKGAVRGAVLEIREEAVVLGWRREEPDRFADWLLSEIDPSGFYSVRASKLLQQFPLSEEEAKRIRQKWFIKSWLAGLPKSEAEPSSWDWKPRTELRSNRIKRVTDSSMQSTKRQSSLQSTKRQIFMRRPPRSSALVATTEAIDSRLAPVEAVTVPTEPPKKNKNGRKAGTCNKQTTEKWTWLYERSRKANQPHEDAIDTVVDECRGSREESAFRRAVRRAVKRYLLTHALPL